MQKYSKMKDSCNSWIGLIPEHWKMLRNKNFLTECTDLVGKRSSEYQLLSLTKGGVIVRDVESGKGKFPKDFETYKIVSKGNVIFCLFDVDETPRTVGLSEKEGMITGAYDVYMPKNINPVFYTYFFLAVDDVKAFRPLYSGLRKVVKQERFLSYKIPVPPLAEQRAIAKFLDAKTVQINGLVEAKQKQIDLLKEYRQSLIADAVTHGINPKAKMKDSGISWIGKIPEHWEMQRNKNFLCECDAVVGKRSNDFQLLSLTKNGVIFRDVESGKGKFPKDFETYKIVSNGNVIFCLFDVDETPRTVGLSDKNGMITGAYDVFQPHGINSEFYTYFFIAVDDIKALRPLYTGLRKVVKKERFLSYKIPVPPLSEQKSIVSYINERTEKLDAQIASIEKQIEQLNEYKQSLISDVVTGKVKVCD